MSRDPAGLGRDPFWTHSGVVLAHQWFPSCSSHSIRRDSVGSLFTECVSELGPEAPVLLRQLPNAGVGRFEAPQQGNVERASAGRELV